MKNNLDQQVCQLEQELNAIKQKIQLLKKQSEFKLNDWLYVNRKYDEYIFRFKEYVSDSYIIGTEIYGVNLENDSDVTIWSENRFLNNHHNELIQLATKQQIERILIAVAKYKGFNIGTQFISAYSGADSICDNKLVYYDIYDDLEVYKGNSIYYKGKWAIIKEESPKLFNTTVSVEELTAVKTVMKVSDRMKRNLFITKDLMCDNINSIEYDQLNDMINKYSKK